MSRIFQVTALVLFSAVVFAAAQTAPDIAALTAKAESGDAKAEFDLGQCYASSHGVPQDQSEAARWFRKAAEQGFVVAQERFANVLLYGYGVTQSTPEALAWFQKAAEHGDVESADMLGQVYENGGPLAVIRRPDGTYSAGPIPPSAATAKDYARAAYWYRIAANHGDAAAQNGIVASAQNSLGRLYRLGEGVPQDYSEAYFWLSLAEANDNTSTTNGVDDRDLAASHLTKAALLQVQDRARKWFEDHAAKRAAQ